MRNFLKKNVQCSINFGLYLRGLKKKMFTRTLVSTRVIRKRRSNTGSEKRKKAGHDIYFINKEGQKVRVCRDFFLKTLGISRDMFTRWTHDEKICAGNISPSSSESDSGNSPKPTKRELPPPTPKEK